jgi:hypothetical protein
MKSFKRYKQIRHASALEAIGLENVHTFKEYTGPSRFGYGG